MKLPIAIMIGLVVFAAYLKANAEEYKYSNGMTINSTDYNTAAKLCFQLLTRGHYPGETKGLEIIDICTNPKTGEIK